MTHETEPENGTVLSLGQLHVYLHYKILHLVIVSVYRNLRKMLFSFYVCTWIIFTSFFPLHSGQLYLCFWRCWVDGRLDFPYLSLYCVFHSLLLFVSPNQMSMGSSGQNYSLYIAIRFIIKQVNFWCWLGLNWELKFVCELHKSILFLLFPMGNFL